MARVATQPQEPVLQPAALQVGIERMTNMAGELLAGNGQVLDESGIMALDELVEQRLLGAVALVTNTAHFQTVCPSPLASSKTAGSITAGAPCDLGVHVEHELMETIRLAKFCPTPDGRGAHAVLETDGGPVTLFYMPRSQAPDAPRKVSLPDGKEGWLINVERGSMALIADSGRDARDLADEIQRQLSFTPGANL